ncbi:Bug family tripartite tricarboxylate transporter substrate binding protein [Variovorax sp.]|jgi:tripartite-type tricarboxylate transporter receptor subunit TctC|uniref:Bug family tripartite tricarboxylate transporter substrate binding protein n=1 Tax=Variovorax sp. TaxID=1871043 RepID=UPI0037D9A52B
MAAALATLAVQTHANEAGQAGMEVGAQATPGWPSKPLRIIVGFGGGSSPDLVARTLAEPLSKSLGQPVIVENRPGASGNIAADIVAKATDRHTIGMLINGNLTIAKLLNPATPYDPQRDLAPISLVCVAPLVLAAPVDSPSGGVTSAGMPGDGKTFLAAARVAGDRWSYGTPGTGTIGHLGMEPLKSKAGLAPVHVPFMGNPQVITAMVGRQIELALLPPGLAHAQVQAGKLRAIGVTSAGRSPLAPQVPSLDELGVHGFQLDIWTAAAGPSSLPAPIVRRLSSLLGEIARQPDVKQKLFQQGYQGVGSTAEELAARIQTDTEQLRGLIASGAVKVQ